MRGKMTDPDTCPTCGAARSELTDALWTRLGEETARANKLELDLARAVETRENANAVSVRVELENRRLREATEPLREALERIASYIEGSKGPDKRVHAGVLLKIAREALDAAPEPVPCPRCHDKHVLDTSYIEEHGWEASPDAD